MLALFLRAHFGGTSGDAAAAGEDARAVEGVRLLGGPPDGTNGAPA